MKKYLKLKWKTLFSFSSVLILQLVLIVGMQEAPLFDRSLLAFLSLGAWLVTIVQSGECWHLREALSFLEGNTGAWSQRVYKKKVYSILVLPLKPIMKNPLNGEWQTCVLYTYAQRRDNFLFVREEKDFEAKFKPLESDDGL